MYPNEDWKPAPIKEEYFKVIKLPAGNEFSHEEFKVHRDKFYGNRKKGGWSKTESEEELKEQHLKKEAALLAEKQE